MISYGDKDKTLRGYTFIDLFCGIGGFHTALASLGAECVFASDIDKDAKTMYELNYQLKPQGDITAIKIEDIPKHDIICAGFPCQPFSISGSQKGYKDKRGKLFFNVVRIARQHKPKVIFLENVKNFEKHNNGKSLARAIEALTGIGYTVYYKVLCASDFGIPQARKRIYIVAFRKDIDSQQFSFPSRISSFKVLNDVLISDADNTVPGTYEISRKFDLKDEIPSTSKNELIRVGKIGKGRQGERIYSTLGVSTTLSTQGGGLGGKTGMYLINGRVRKLYPRECARVMGFPDTYILAPTQEQNYKQFGNSVVVELIQLISEQIAKILSIAKNKVDEEKNAND